ncbi:hypothetical protein FOE31_24745 [Salmonella enterica]|nr:hypothetical protein [Salmonella enterica]
MLNRKTLLSIAVLAGAASVTAGAYAAASVPAASGTYTTVDPNPMNNTNTHVYTAKVATTPTTITDTNMRSGTDLTAIDAPNTVIGDQTFVTKDNHIYKIVGASRSGADKDSYSISFSSTNTLEDVSHTELGKGESATWHIITSKNTGSPMVAGDTTISYTLSDYAS